MLIFETGWETVSWYQVSIESNGAETASGAFSFEPEGGYFPREIVDLARKPQGIAYVLENGGQDFVQPVTEISPAIIEKLGSCRSIWPERCAGTARLILDGFQTFPDRKHLLLCETGFFHALPERARFYALPQPYRDRIPRYGSSGLSHAWADRAAGHPRRLISILLGDRPGAAAILDGQAVEICAGFTSLEGLPSLTSSGDVDPSIVIELLRLGLTPEDARRLLSREAGYQVFSGKASSLAQIIADENLPRRMLLNALVKTVGTMLAALGGADVIAVTMEDRAAWQTFLIEFEARLAFLNDLHNAPNFMPLTASRTDILRDYVRPFLKE